MDVDADILESVKNQLESLKRTPDGAFLYRIVSRALEKYGVRDGKVEQAFLLFLHGVLSKYVNEPGSNPSTRIKAKLIQQRLLIYLPPELIRKAEARQAAPTNEKQPAARPVTAQRPPPAPRQVEAEEVEILPAAGSRIVEPQGQPSGNRPGGSPAEAEEPVLEQETLPERLADTIVRNKEINALLRSNLKALQLASSGEDLLDLKQLLIRGMQDLIQGNNHLTEDIDATSHLIKAARSDQERMRSELQVARKHGATDPLTGLPMREGLVKYLRAEIGRAKRYGFSLAMTIIDIDDLGAINERYGRQLGDEVIQCYVREVLSLFRSYDVVGRYGGDEFAVIFPNTQKEGAYHALQKAQRTVADIIINHRGEHIPLPGFTSVLAMYAQGENPEDMMNRANEALALAKTSNKGKLVVSLPTH